MWGKAYLYKPGDEIPQVTELNKAPTLEFLQQQVEGYVEKVPEFTKYIPPGEDKPRKCTVYCNEDGLMKQLPLNVIPTRLWNSILRNMGRPLRDPCILVGPILITVNEPRKLQSGAAKK